MRARALSTNITDYEEAELTDYNAHGFKPVSDQIVVWPDVAIRKTTGGIHIPDAMAQDHDMATQSGILVAVGEGAFIWTSDRMREYVGAKPKVGDRVVFPKYSGKQHGGNDGRKYLMMDDKAVLAIKEGAANG